MKDTVNGNTEPFLANVSRFFGCVPSERDQSRGGIGRHEVIGMSLMVSSSPYMVLSSPSVEVTLITFSQQPARHIKVCLVNIYLIVALTFSQLPINMLKCYPYETSRYGIMSKGQLQNCHLNI